MIYSTHPGLPTQLPLFHGPTTWPAWERKTKAQGRDQGVPGLRHPASVYLPRAKGHKPGVLAERALPDLVHELGQLGVCPTTVIDLLQRKRRGFQRGDCTVPEYPLHITECHGPRG